MNRLPLEPYDRRSYLAWVANHRSPHRCATVPLDDVPRRSEAFAEDVEDLTGASSVVAMLQRSGRSAASAAAATAVSACVAA